MSDVRNQADLERIGVSAAAAASSRNTSPPSSTAASRKPLGQGAFRKAAI